MGAPLAESRRHAVVRYGSAVSCLAAAVVLYLLLGRLLNPTAFFLGAIMAATWFGGRGPGLVTVVLATVMADYYLGTPTDTFKVDLNTLPRLGVFALAAVFATWASDARRRAEASLRTARDELDAKVTQRTAALAHANARLAAEVGDRRRAESLLRATLESTADGILVTDFDGKIVAANQKFAAMWGIPPEPLAARDGHEALLALADRLAEPEAGLPRVRALFTEPEAESFDVLELKGGRVVECYSHPQRVAGKSVGRVWSFRDVTERRRAEEASAKAQAELARVTRVTTMGELAASIAHEINQPLGAVVANASASRRWLSADPPNLREALEAIERIIDDGNRAAEVIGRIRALMTKSAPERWPLGINDVIRETLDVMRGELRKHRVVVRTVLDERLPLVVGDRVQLQQVLVNLILNAIEAMAAVPVQPRILGIKSELHEPEGVLVEVQDSGVGLEPASAGRIFESFFSTKPAGLGMGLSISRSIIEAHGGRLWATANAGAGATLHFTLPIAR